LLPPGRFPLLPRKKHTDKSDYGHVLVLAGSRNMTGAAILAGRAAMASGAGLVTVASPVSASKEMAGFFEAIRLPLPETKSGGISLRALTGLSTYMRRRKVSSIVVGPGLGLDPETQALVRRLVSASPPCVLDADGLNAFRWRSKLLAKRASPLILTPHEKEFERLFDRPVPAAAAARWACVKKISGAYGVVLVLKGHRTLVAGAGRAYVNATGNPGMAKGGTGDVLAGIIGAFVAQGMVPFEAAAWGVHFHGKAGDAAARKKGELGIFARDLIDYLPHAFRAKR
jgi:NAD(P)H-hydrate epimerase